MADERLRQSYDRLLAIRAEQAADRVGCPNVERLAGLLAREYPHPRHLGRVQECRPALDDRRLGECEPEGFLLRQPALCGRLAGHEHGGRHEGGGHATSSARRPIRTASQGTR
jgi:hypothetical protein